MRNNDINLKLANVILDLAKQSEENGKYEDAIKSYKEVLNVFEQALGVNNEKTKEIYSNIGMCYKALGKNEEALSYLTKALSSGNATSVVSQQKETKIKQNRHNKAKETKTDRLLNDAEEFVCLGNENYDDGYDEEYDVEKAPKIRELSNYEDNYSDSGFWNTAKKLGKKVLKPALQLYYVLKEPSTPHNIKGMIIGALGYLILPVDLIPDFIPVAGYTDDFAALMAVIKMCSEHITPEIERKVEEDLG